MRVLTVCVLLCLAAGAEAKRFKYLPAPPNMPPVLVDDRPVVQPPAPPCSPECTCGCNEGQACQCNTSGVLMRAWRARSVQQGGDWDPRKFWDQPGLRGRPLLPQLIFRGPSRTMQNCGPGG